MIFELFGYLCSSLIIAVVISWKFRRDIYPYALKKFLTRLSLQNWTHRQPQQLIQYDTLHAQSTFDIGILATESETCLEKPVQLQCIHDSDQLTFYGIDAHGNGLVTKITRFYDDLVQATICLMLNGETYSVFLSATVPTSSQEFSIGNLKFELVEPMRIWRVWYNGSLIKQKKHGQDACGAGSHAKDSVHARINLLWKPLDWPFDCKKDVNIELLAEHLAKEGNFGWNFTDLSSKILPNGYTQFGTQNGIVQLDSDDDGGDEKKISFYGFRQRHFFFKDNSAAAAAPNSIISSSRSKSTSKMTMTNGQKYINNDDHCSIELFGMCDSNGNVFRLAGLNHGSWTDGHTLYPSMDRNPILHVDVQPSEFVISQNSGLVLPKLFVLSDKKESFHVEIWPAVQSFELDPHSAAATGRATGSRRVFEMNLIRLDINGKEGRGILLKTWRNADSRQIQDQIMENLVQNRVVETRSLLGVHELEVLPFDSLITCPNEIGLVGGKGASLAKLRSISRNGGQFGTANGFCITTKLFSSVMNSLNIKKLFDSKQAAGDSGSNDDLEKTCKKVISLIKSSNAKELIEPSVAKMLGDLFKDSPVEKKRFAVRSSGVLEDTLDLSAAGQNETFLNVPSQMICTKIVDCWASLFTMQSVLYRLNHGQPIWSEMGVVVQEMIQAKCAGVLFTADPRTGNPFELIINGNYGLGESVVSGICEPDTIILKKSKQFRTGNSLTIGEKKLGSKNVKIVSSTGPVGEGTAQLEIDAKVGSQFCLTDEQALRLGEIGLEIEKQLGNLRPIDIEWAVDEDDRIVILQSRTITSLDMWTEDELIHEMDTAIRTSFERFTTANTGEVMPGATSHLGISITTRILDASICSRLTNMYKDRMTIPYFPRSTSIARQRLLLSMINMLYRQVEKEVSPTQAAIELTVFGHRLNSDEFQALGEQRFGPQSPLKQLCAIPQAAYEVYDSLKEIKRVSKKYDNYKSGIDLTPSSSEDKSQVLYEKLTNKLFDLLDIGKAHCHMSQASSMTNMFAFLTLAAGKSVEEWDAPLYEDISKILTVGINVESADIPKAIDQLANIIATHEPSSVAKEFVDSKPVAALKLINETSRLNEALEEFFEKHGHRSFAELDLMRQSWKTEPLPLISLLQNIVNNKLKYPDSTSWSTGSKFESPDQLLDSLNTKLSSGSRRFLKFILKYCAKAVQNREKTKSLLVRALGEMKLVYNHLAKLLVKERLLNDPKLIYFMTHHEIGLVVRRDSSISRILYKAMRRMKIYPELNKEHYPEIIMGQFEPAQNPDEHVEMGDQIQATPLSTGKVQSIVKVCLSVEEASTLLEPGDILITKGTDIAWSPFFPMLGGIITELGGLMSHGAVVAREYGLPCVVGAANATKIFKTGEKVILDARTGIVTKVLKEK